MAHQIKPLLGAASKITGGCGGDDWRIICGDSLKILPRLPEKSANLIFADPPYNLQLKNKLYRPNMTKVSGVDDDWDKFESFDVYDEFCRAWLLECRRLLADDGTLWVIGSYHNIGRLARLMQDIGYWLLNDVIWKKSNPMPNFRGVRFTNATETLLWAKKSEKAKYTFNHQQMKAENGGKQMTSVWEFPLCGGKERLRDTHGDKLHSTQKPEALLRRVIMSSTNPGDVVVNPFLGSGTTLGVARKLGRIGVGIEREKKYTQLAYKRVLAARKDFVILENPIKPPRVAFKKLIEERLIKKGRNIYFRQGEIKAQILQSGNIKLNGQWNQIGSIHRMGALAGDSAECNGWMNWYIKESDGFVCINEIREKYRSRIGT
ncbi:MAG: DNA methyltransferase [Candidatus Zeuxoniibacter abyssi]|nr:MAG: DNA methyltransferase [Candidatus Persebacteraceae bacterium AB1(2)]